MKILALMLLLSGCAAQPCLTGSISRSREQRVGGRISYEDWERVKDIYYSDLSASEKCAQIDAIVDRSSYRPAGSRRRLVPAGVEC